MKMALNVLLNAVSKEAMKSARFSEVLVTPDKVVWAVTLISCLPSGIV